MKSDGGMCLANLHMSCKRLLINLHEHFQYHIGLFSDVGLIFKDKPIVDEDEERCQIWNDRVSSVLQMFIEMDEDFNY